MWRKIHQKYGTKYKAFVKVDDDTIVFYDQFTRKMQSSPFPFFGNFKQYYQPEKDGIPWITGCFYGFSANTLKTLVNALKNKKNKQEFLSRGSAEDVSVSVLLSKMKIQPAHWKEIKVWNGIRTFKEILFRKERPVCIGNLTTFYLKIMYLLLKR